LIYFPPTYVLLYARALVHSVAGDPSAKVDVAAMAAIDQEEAAGGPLNAQGQMRMGLFWNLSLADRYTMLTAAVHGMALERWRAERLLSLWDWMSGHRDPAVRIIGLYGRAWLQGDEGKKAREELFASLSQRPCPLPASAVQRMAGDLSLGSTPAEGAKWHGLVPPPPRTPRQAKTQPSRPMKRLSPFLEDLSPPDKWNAWSKYRLCPVAVQGMQEGSARIVHVMLDEHGNRASTAGAVVVLWDLSGRPAAQRWLCPTPPKEVRPYGLWKLTPGDGALRKVYAGDGVKLELVSIPAGEFLMGSPESDDKRCERESPQHLVRITRPFQLGKYPITQRQWQAVLGGNPSFFQGPQNPVEGVSWDDCQKFIARLNEKFAAGRGTFRLPTEAQWEYACRAGSTTRYCFGDDESELPQYAWCRCAFTRNHAAQPVGGKKPNAWGLYDVHGNVRQWCADWYDQDYYAESPADDPPGAAKGLDRVWRGGDWMATPWSCTSAHRSFGMPMYAYSNVGLRVCLVSPEATQGSSQLPAAGSADRTRPKTGPVKTIAAKDAIRAALGELKRRFDFDGDYSANPQHGSPGWRVLIWKDPRAAPTWEVLLTDEGEVLSVKGEKEDRLGERKAR
jgi:formylglycine-generating enzyme required for sulfatase activity